MEARLYTGKDENLETVRVLVEQLGADINKADKVGNNSLHYAAIRGNLKVAQWLIQKGVRFSTSHPYRTPIYIAVFRQNYNFAKWLAQQWPGIDEISESGVTPLYVAAEKGHISVAKWFVQQGANVNKSSTNRQTPLYAALKNKHFELAQWLIQQGAKVFLGKFSDRLAWFILLKEGSLQICRFAIKAGMNVNSTVLKIPILYEVLDYEGDDAPKKASLLLENGANPTKKAIVCPSKFFITDKPYAASFFSDMAINNYHLFMAAQEGNCRTLKKLLHKHTNLVTGNALFYSSLKGHTEAVKLLLVNGANPNHTRLTEKCTPLHGAVQNNHLEVIGLLLDAGADPTLKTDEGETPLDIAQNCHYAEAQRLLATAVYGWELTEVGSDYEKCKALLQKGVNPNTDFALHKAVQDGNELVAHELLNVGADGSLLNDDGDAPLHLVARGNYLEMVPLLGENAQLDFNQFSVSGDTALHLAARSGHTNMVDVLLLNYNAELALTDAEGNTALHWICRTFDDEALSEFLELHEERVTHLLQQRPANSRGETPLFLLLQRNDKEISQQTRDRFIKLTGY